jgi:malonate-semialdehyde dehydrogenase (acetylating)/methylmalonate-semialdehyde dehydrogenase
VQKNIPHYIGNQWVFEGTELAVINPANNQSIGSVSLGDKEVVDRVVQESHRAFSEWKKTPVTERVQYLFKLKNLLEENIEDLAETITLECGKTKAESLGELRRGIENVEVACGMPMMIQGQINEDIARGIDEFMIRQPLGVVAAITPFNFPAMIPLWFLPYALASGNCFILKPSEKVPMTCVKLFELIHKLDLPSGVLQLLHGGKESVDALLEHSQVRAISFVGSTPVAKYIYSKGTQNAKRVQCQGGAKNPVVIMPDADLETTTKIMADSAFGCAGQRCLAASVAITVGQRKDFLESIVEAAKKRRVGFGLDSSSEMGPVISSESKERIQNIIKGKNIIAGGEAKKVQGFENGFFLAPTILDEVGPESEIARTEIFGPVLSLMHAKDLDEAIEWVNQRAYGNMACLFTSNGAYARRFRSEVQAGNVGINIGVAAPMAFFPFSGWRESFFGDLHAQGRHAVEFYTETKVVVERWPKEWSRQF